MKRIIFFLAFTSCIAFNSVAQEYPLTKSSLQFNIGSGISNWGIPFNFGFDIGLKYDISIGAELSYRNYSGEVANASYNSKILGFSGNGNYHFNRIFGMPPNWDFYAGINAGFYHWKSDRGYDRVGKSGFGFGIQVGGRYYWSEFWGINAELIGGNKVRTGKIGLSVRF